MTAWNILKPLPSEATKRALGELLYDPRVELKFEENSCNQTLPSFKQPLEHFVFIIHLHI